MIPWENVSHDSFSDSEEDVRAKVADLPHSRIPVTDGDVVVRVLLKKEIPDSQYQDRVPWQGILRQTVKVKADQKVLEAFLKMQEKQTPLAIVENEEEKFVGIITKLTATTNKENNDN